MSPVETLTTDTIIAPRSAFRAVLVCCRVISPSPLFFQMDQIGPIAGANIP
jgi:hypothetical protein